MFTYTQYSIKYIIIYSNSVYKLNTFLTVSKHIQKAIQNCYKKGEQIYKNNELNYIIFILMWLIKYMWMDSRNHITEILPREKKRPFKIVYMKLKKYFIIIIRI